MFLGKKLKEAQSNGWLDTYCELYHKKYGKYREWSMEEQLIIDLADKIKKDTDRKLFKPAEGTSNFYNSFWSAKTQDSSYIYISISTQDVNKSYVSTCGVINQTFTAVHTNVKLSRDCSTIEITENDVDTVVITYLINNLARYAEDYFSSIIKNLGE